MARKKCERGKHVCRILTISQLSGKKFQAVLTEASQSGRFYLVFFIGETWKQTEVLLFRLHSEKSTLTIKILNMKQSVHQNHQRLLFVLQPLKCTFLLGFGHTKKTTGKNKSFLFHKIENANCQSGKCNWLITYGQNELKLFTHLNNAVLPYCSQHKKNNRVIITLTNCWQHAWGGFTCWDRWLDFV